MKSFAEKLSDLRGLEADPKRGGRLSSWERNFIRDIDRVTSGGVKSYYLSGNQIYHINRLHFSNFEEVKKMPQDVVKGRGKTLVEKSPPATPASTKNPPGGKFWENDLHTCPWCKGDEEKVQYCVPCEGTGTSFTKEVEE